MDYILPLIGLACIPAACWLLTQAGRAIGQAACDSEEAFSIELVQKLEQARTSRN